MWDHTATLAWRWRTCQAILFLASLLATGCRRDPVFYAAEMFPRPKVVVEAKDDKDDLSANWVTPPPVDPQVVGWIDQLTEVADEGPGTHSTASVVGFLAVDEQFAFGGGIIGSRRPVVHPAMRQLVRLGLRALPDLLNHLSDPRKTRLTVGSRGSLFGGSWHGDYYDPRHRDPRLHPPGVNTGTKPVGERRYVEEYTLRVGDLCYVALGQIINRGLSATQYIPSGCLEITSPVATPALAAAARKDWAGLTRDQHRESLIGDALDVSMHSATGPLRRLYHYYPEAAEAVALKLLNRPWYDDGKVRDFIKGRLVKEKDRQSWENLLAGFRAENGAAAAETVPFWLHRIYWRSDREQDREFLEGKAVATRILAEVYPDYDPLKPRFINAATSWGQAELIKGLAGLGGPEIDDAVAKVFRSPEWKALKGLDRLDADDLVLACMDRLLGKGMDGEFEEYCEKRIAELKGKKREIAEDQRLELLQHRLGLIREAQAAPKDGP